MTLYPRLAAAGLMLAAVLAGCSEPAQKAETSAPAPAPAVAANPDVHAFRIGQLEAVALKDGDIVMPNDGKASPWSNTEEVAALAGAVDAADGKIHLSVQPLLVRDGDRVVLIDTGAGGQMGTQNKLQASLRTAGVDPAQVTDILISHAHGDHVGGLMANGALAFPNAVIHVSIPEWTAMQAYAPQADMVRALTPRVRPFAPGAQVTPSIRAVSLDGHTPGHTGYEITSGDARLLYIGDALHSSIISVQRPDWTNVWDDDNAAAVATRQALLERGASRNLLIYGVHFPFPGLGRFQRRDDGFIWVPETPAQP
ncbi:MBL fold metallo-hydrolase [Brevundimonas lenta]|uniref:Glyoxylase-like metal-dependent hydrolase (Beta-lactamase superfamily II) n=1 Tax=Brevundimonas lenta TaxID=424796 RepID=A0A7W6JGV5_9CAUL|nr:MBL fold metallo-hydrolase [Brevundimonas lenta]MBB4083938.1 glyoxylase-like metal-dependent hydrolase (beta-lactamase superfamily II) [Brevundimonas lenta]